MPEPSSCYVTNQLCDLVIQGGGPPYPPPHPHTSNPGSPLGIQKPHSNPLPPQSTYHRAGLLSGVGRVGQPTAPRGPQPPTSHWLSQGRYKLKQGRGEGGVPEERQLAQ